MATGSQSFYSTPAFELFRRGLNVQTIKNFRGINVFQGQAQLEPEWALDCMNVLVPGWGGLSKFRQPVAISALIPAGPVTGPDSFWEFQQGNGTRQVVANFGNSLYYYNWLANGILSAATLIETAPGDAGPWSFVESNQILFGTNGQVMKKWTGTAWQNWGFGGPAVPPGTGGVAILGTTNLINEPNYSNNSVVNSSGITTSFAFAPGTFSVSVGQSVTIAGNSQAGFNATWVVTGVQPSNLGDGSLFVRINTPGISDGRQGSGGTIIAVTGLPAIGWEYAYAYKNSITGHIGNRSPATSQIIPAGGMGPQLTALAPTDSQVDTIVWYRTVDGGGDLYRLCEVNLATGVVTTPNAGTNVASVISGGKYIILNDYLTTDSALDTLTTGALVNNPPLVGKYVAVGQSRVFVFNLIGSPQDIIYSGYEQILTGRPEESFPPSNRLRLSIGADDIMGGGVLQSGVVAFSKTHKMYMLRGAVEDVTFSAPVAFSAYLEELPYDVGTLGHNTIRSTSYGLFFWATDRTVQLFDGMNKPVDISGPVYPILRKATRGSEINGVGAYFNWLERDWYGLTFPYNGSPTNNYTIFWALDIETGNMNIFPASFGMNFMAGISTGDLQRILAISNGGIIYSLPVAQDVSGGIGDPTVIPNTNKPLAANWRSGYFGNDSPARSKMYKRGLLVSDRDGFQVNKRYVNNRTSTFQNPEVRGPSKVRNDNQFSLGRRANRVSIELLFPPDDATCNVMELSVGSIPTSDRM